MKTFKFYKVTNQEIIKFSISILIISLISSCSVGQSIPPSKEANIENTENYKIVGIGIERPKTPDIDGKVCGQMPEVKYNGEDLKTFFMSQPMPEMWIVERNAKEGEIDCGGERLDLSPESQKILMQHWQDTMEAWTYFYSGLPAEGKKSRVIQKDSLKVPRLDSAELEKTLVRNNSKQRNISPDEVVTFSLFLGEAEDLVLKAVDGKLFKSDGQSGGGFTKVTSGIDSKVCGQMPEVKYNGEDLKTFFMSQPMPEMWIVERNAKEGEIDCGGERLDLSPESKKLLLQHWNDRLEYIFLLFSNPVGKGAESYRRELKLAESYLGTKNNLERNSVSNEKRTRKITPEEAEQIVFLWRDSANKIGRAVKEGRKEK